MDSLQEVARISVPDPFEPVVGLKLGTPSNRPFGEHSGPYRRRARILAETRRSLAREGHDRITIRSVSDGCGLTPQTIHNSFGSKADLLRSAMNEHTLMIDSFAFARSCDPEVFLLLALAYCQSAVNRPDFVREYMRATFSPRHTLKDKLMKFGVDLKLHILRDLAQRQLLRSFVDYRSAAEQIACINTFAMHEWAEHDDIAQLYARIVHGNGSLLLGILVPEAGREIETWLAGQFRSGAPHLSGVAAPVPLPEHSRAHR